MIFTFILHNSKQTFRQFPFFVYYLSTNQLLHYKSSICSQTIILKTTTISFLITTILYSLSLKKQNGALQN
jgi:hypothetical protein